MSGWDLAERARKQRPGIRVLFTSGFNEAAMTGGGGRLDPQNILLQKPYRRKEHANAVASALNAGPRAQ